MGQNVCKSVLFYAYSQFTSMGHCTVSPGCVNNTVRRLSGHSYNLLVYIKGTMCMTSAFRNFHTKLETIPCIIHFWKKKYPANSNDW